MSKEMNDRVLDDVREFRKSLGENQTEFWARLGLTQPGGSRYENGQNIPAPTALLLCLLASGKITKEDVELLLSDIKDHPNVSIS